MTLYVHLSCFRLVAYSTKTAFGGAKSANFKKMDFKVQVFKNDTVIVSV